MTRRLSAWALAATLVGCFEPDVLVATCVDAGRCVFDSGSGSDGGSPPADAGPSCELPPPAGDFTGSRLFHDAGFVVVRLELRADRTEARLEQYDFGSDGGRLLVSLPLSIATDAGRVLFDRDPTQHHLSRSADGRFLVTAAYVVPDELLSALGDGGAQLTRLEGVARAVLRVDAAGTIDVFPLRSMVFGGQQAETSPRLIRSAATATGSQFWAVGNVAGLRSFAADTPGRVDEVFSVPGNVAHVHATAETLFVSTVQTFNSFNLVQVGLARSESCASPLGVVGVGVRPAATATIRSASGLRLLVAGASDGGVYEYTLGNEAALRRVLRVAGATSACTHLAANDDGSVLCRTTADVISTATDDSGVPEVVLPSAPFRAWRGISFPPR